MRFLARSVANALGILLASLFFTGFAYTGNFKTLVLAGVLLALAHIILRPLLKLLSLPLIIITLGLFTVVINMVVLKIVDYFFVSLAIATLGALFWGTVLVSVVDGIALAFVRPKERQGNST